MAINLQKGQKISLDKEAGVKLTNITMGLGWDPVKTKGIFGFGSKTQEVDLDASCILFDEQGKQTDAAWFRQLKSKDGSIVHTGDNRTGAGDGDDEQIIVKLNDLPQQYTKVVFVVQIYKGLENKQSFGMVKNAFIRAVDGKKREMVRFDLSGGAAYENCRSMLFAEMVREADGWKFNALGTPSASDSFVEWLKKFA